MSNKLSFARGLAYIGTNANQPPNMHFEVSDPTQYNTDASVGDLWLNTDTENLWYLGSLAGDANSEGILADWIPFGTGGTGIVIEVHAGENISVTGTQANPIVNVAGTTNFAVQIGNNLGALTSLTPGLTGEVLLGVTGAAPVFGAITNGILPGNGAITLNNGQNITVTGSPVSLGGAATIAFSGILPIVNGGTFNSSSGIGGNTAYSTNGIFYYDGTRFQTTGVGLAAQVLTSNGPGVAPTFQNGGGGGGGASLFTEDTGTATPTGPGNIFFKGGARTGNTGINLHSTGDGVNTVTYELNNSIQQPITSADGTAGVYALGNDALPGGYITDRFLHAFGTNNTFLGQFSGNMTLTVGSATENTGIGLGTLNHLTTGLSNTATGASSLTNVTTGSRNTALGDNAARDITTGSDNTALGYAAGLEWSLGDSSNIALGNDGVTGDNNIIRIGTQGAGAGEQNKAFMAGIYGVTPAGVARIMQIDANGQMGTTAALTNGQVLIGSTGANAVAATITAGANITIVNGAGTITISSTGGGGGGATSFPTDTGTATPAAGVLNLFSIAAPGNPVDNLHTRGAGNTATFELNNSIFQPNTNLAGDQGLYQLGGLDFISNYGTQNAFLGGAGNRTGTFNTGTATQSVGVGYQALFSQTTGKQHVAVGYRALASVTSPNMHTAVGSQALENLTTAAQENTAVGCQAGQNNATGSANVFLGKGAGRGAISGIGNNNVFIGWESGIALDLGNDNVFIGYTSGHVADGCSQNVFIGSGSGEVLGTGNGNIYLGYHAGFSANDVRTTRIGTEGASFSTQNVFIKGIYGQTYGGVNAAVRIDNADKLGTVASSIRFKENVQDMGIESEGIMDLRPVVFTWKKERDPLQGASFGLIAEEVQEIFPWLVNKDDQGIPFTVRYEDMIPMLLNELQKQNKRIDQLEAMILKHDIKCSDCSSE